MRDRLVIKAALVVQAVCAGFFISDILSSWIGFRSTPISWQFRELIEIGAAAGLLLGFVLGAVALHRSRQRQLLAERGLERVSAAFMDLVEASAKYADLFWLMTWIGLGCAVVAFLVAPLTRRWMHGIK